jgi:hypothetical protein
MIACGSLGWLIFIRKVPARDLPDEVSRYVLALKEPYFFTFPPTDKIDNFDTVGSGRKHVLFIGDSTIGHYVPRISKILSDHPDTPYSAVLALAPACSIAYEIAFHEPDGCRRTVESALEYAKNPDVETVVIGAAWYLQFVEISDWAHVGEPGPLKAGTDRAVQKIEDRITRLVTEGKRVYLLLSSPISADYDVHQVVRRSILPPGFRMNVRTPQRSEVLEAIKPITEKLKNAARKAGAIVIDPMDSLCDTTTCPGFTSSGKPMYRDSVHLLPSYVRDHVLYLDETILKSSSSVISSGH